MLGSGVLCLALLPCQHAGSVVTGSKKGGSKLCSSFSHRALRAQRGTTASRVCWGHWCEAARVAASVTMLETRRWSCPAAGGWQEQRCWRHHPPNIPQQRRQFSRSFSARFAGVQTVAVAGAGGWCR